MAELTFIPARIKLIGILSKCVDGNFFRRFFLLLSACFLSTRKANKPVFIRKKVDFYYSSDHNS